MFAKKKLKQSYVFGAIAATTCAGAVIATIVIHQPHASSPSSTLHIGTNFPSYYPKYLPSGYNLQADSLSVRNSVAIFTATNGRKKIAFTEQAKPSQYDFSQLNGDAEFQTTLGQAYVDSFDDRTTGSVVANQTWVIINSQPPISTDEMRQILESLQPAN